MMALILSAPKAGRVLVCGRGKIQVSLEEEIAALASEIEALLPRFNKTEFNHVFLTTQDQSKLKQLTLEAASAIDALLGTPLNDFSPDLYSLAKAPNSYASGPSVAKVSDAAESIRGALNQYRRKQMAGASGPASTRPSKPSYVDLTRIEALQSLKSDQWDFLTNVRRTQCRS
jgi:hypothetical protein